MLAHGLDAAKKVATARGFQAQWCESFWATSLVLASWWLLTSVTLHIYKSPNSRNDQPIPLIQMVHLGGPETYDILLSEANSWKAALDSQLTRVNP